jgi:hypothetical protein
MPFSKCPSCRELGVPGDKTCMLETLSKDLDKPNYVKDEPLATVLRLLGICPNSEIVLAVIQIVNKLTRT